MWTDTENDTENENPEPENPEPENPEPENPETEVEAQDQDAAAEANEPAADPKPDLVDEGPSAEDHVAALKTEVAELEDKWRRALAEGENVRRRAERDKQDALKYGATNLAREILSVADNLRRALDSVSEEARAADETLSALWVGIEMTEREMLNAFERISVKPIEAEGQRLDPYLHEAMYEVENPDVPAGTIIHVVQVGYKLHDRLLRPAKVGVARGGPKDVAAPAGEAKPDTAETAEKKDKAQAYDKKGEGKGGKLDQEL